MKDEPIIIYEMVPLHEIYPRRRFMFWYRCNSRCTLSPGEVFHLSSGRETTILELGAQMLCDIVGKLIIQLFKSFVVVSRNFTNYSKAHSTFGFEPKVSIKDGLASTWEWFCLNHEFVNSTHVA